MYIEQFKYVSSDLIEKDASIVDIYFMQGFFIEKKMISHHISPCVFWCQMEKKVVNVLTRTMCLCAAEEIFIIQLKQY